MTSNSGNTPHTNPPKNTILDSFDCQDSADDLAVEDLPFKNRSATGQADDIRVLDASGASARNWRAAALEAVEVILVGLSDDEVDALIEVINDIIRDRSEQSSVSASSGRGSDVDDNETE